MHCLCVHPLGNKQTRQFSDRFSLLSITFVSIGRKIGRTMGSDKVLKTINNFNLILFPFSEKVTNEMLRWTLPVYP